MLHIEFENGDEMIDSSAIQVLAMHNSSGALSTAMNWHTMCGLESGVINVDDDARYHDTSHGATEASSIPEAGTKEEECMIWVFGGVGYLVAVASIVRFFRFVSDTDRSIQGLIAPKDGSAQVRDAVPSVKSSSPRVTKYRQPILAAKTARATRPCRSYFSNGNGRYGSVSS